jgi:hypothetical protein
VLTSNGASSAPSWQAAAGGTSDKIEDGNTYIEVDDTGDGSIDMTIDVVQRMDFTDNTCKYIFDGSATSYNWLEASLDSNRSLGLYMKNTQTGTDRYISWSANHETTVESRGCFQLRTRWSDNVDGSRTSEVAWGVADGGSWDVDFLTIDGHQIGIGTNSPNATLTVQGNITPGTDDTYDVGTASYRWDDIYATNTTIQSSDERLKDDITDSDLGLDFICDLRPISYRWKDYTATERHHVLKEDEYDEDGNQLYVEEEMEVEHTYARTHYGMVAQEVEATLSEHGKTTEQFAGFIHNEDADMYGLRYAEFIAPMIKSIQELKAENDDLKAKYNDLLARVEELENA